MGAGAGRDGYRSRVSDRVWNCDCVVAVLHSRSSGLQLAGLQYPRQSCRVRVVVHDAHALRSLMRTPAPPPFLGMNSTPARASSRFCSNAEIVGRGTADASASSSRFQSSKARAVLHRRLDLLFAMVPANGARKPYDDSGQALRTHACVRRHRGRSEVDARAVQS
jgi:hypothetical protein